MEDRKNPLEKIAHENIIIVTTRLVGNKYTDTILIDGEELNEEDRKMYKNMGGISNRTIMAHQGTNEAKTVYAYQK